MRYVPEKGDIVWLDFDPSSGHEIMKRRPAFVISKKVFNATVGMVVVAPITSAIRHKPLEVVLSEKNLKTKGAVLVYQMKSLDVSCRKIKFIEKASAVITDKVTALAQLIVG